MDDPARVRVSEAFEHLGRGLDRVGVVHRPGAERLAQRLARHVLVGDVDVVRVSLETVGAEAAFVPETGGRERLALGPRSGFALARDDLQRDVEPRPLVAREPDRARAAAPERAQGPVAPGDELAGGERNCRLGHEGEISRRTPESCAFRLTR